MPPRPSHALALILACGPQTPSSDTADPGATSTTANTSTSTTDPSPTTTADPSTSTSDPPTTTTSSATCAETFSPNSCGEAVVTIPAPAIAVVFALEKSVSMVSVPGGQWDHDADDLDDDGQSDADPDQPATPKTSRWMSLYHAVSDTLTQFDAALVAGLALFPGAAATLDYTVAACPADAAPIVPLAPQNAAAIIAALPAADATDLKGASPGAAAIASATTALAELEPEFARHIVYVTDGAANCHAGSDPPPLFETLDPDLAARVTDATAQEITTHVIGIAIPDSTSPNAKDGEPDDINTHDHLDQLATLGGAALPGPTKFHLATRESDLLLALDTILRSTRPCVVTLDPPPPGPDHVEIHVDNISYGTTSVVDCTTEDGWHYLEPGLTIELCGAACRDYQRVGSVEATYHCPPTPC